MSKKNKSKQSRNAQMKESKSNNVFLCDPSGFETFITSGYTPLSRNPEIIAGVNKIASIVGMTTIHLMENRNNGDYRIKNALSRFIDIEPNRYMTRSTLMQNVVRNLLLEGDGNAVLFPRTKDGQFEGLYPLHPSSVSFVSNEDFGYDIYYNGVKYSCDDFVHIVLNPDPNYPWKGEGLRKTLKSVAETLQQASATKKGFMESKWKPSIIVKVDSMAEEFETAEGREKLLDKYVISSEDGKPWMIPADSFEVTTVKPLSLQDLAIKDGVELDKKTVASILDMPSFILGVGQFNKEEWNTWINTRIRAILTAIEQGLTRTLLIKPEWYFRFNYRSLYSYDIQTLATVGCDLYTRGIVSGNEVRDSLNYSPRDGLDELIILENYIPQGMIGDQKKLNKGGDSNDS